MIADHTTLLPIAAPPLEAGWGDLAPLVLLVFWIARQVMSAIGEQKRAENEPPEPIEIDLEDNLDLDQEPALGGRPKAAPQGGLRAEVDEFLKRVEATRELQGEPAEARALPVEEDFTPPTEVINEPGRRGPIDPFEEPPRRARRTPRPARARPPELEPTPPQPVRQQASPVEYQSVGERAELRHLPESQLAEQAAHLGGQIAQSDDRLEQRLQQKFDHRLGKLKERVDTPEEMPKATEPETGAARIKALLARPGGVREAVVLSEILRRPGEDL